ncbi:MAG: alpha-amylase [bacterium]|nr:alpha-amylase [bacterium]
MEFHISREARDKYEVDESLFTVSGNLVLPDFPAIQRFAQKIETRAGQINAMGLIDEIFHYVIKLYKEQINPKVMTKAMDWLSKACGSESLDSTLRLFAKEFPPLAVYHGTCSIAEYMEKETAGVPHRHLLLEEMMMLWLANENTALSSYKEKLFDDKELAGGSVYKKVISELELFFQYQPPFGPQRQNLLAMLRSPAIAVPESLPGQLDYIREYWGLMLESILARLLTSLDLIKEEEKFGGIGPGQTPVYDFSDSSLFEEYESFTPDLHWMPCLVLIAKSTHVWLDQLSKKYKTEIKRVDQIPDEELDELASRGFTGLWLIGVWERSHASQRIKQMCGNPEAMASAYSIYDYRIADELGGEDALKNLKQRAWQRGLRMASDMVPNHMGIDSPWVVEHPDWFLSLDHSPYPNYTFNGPDLSSDSRVGIFLEDHYYDRTDAAVVFKHVDNGSGRVRYIYHGNDGTAMPWNDTAQLNYLHPEVREAVTRTMFSVAEKFPVIRFDAAMTLAKKHFQRLWYPEPGAGGDIPTRAGKGLSKADFNKEMPEEFWRKVVDRFADANSDTLLLAEAFWLMEAYFVRTLGMHRVYNSAFMHFLKNEDNAQFRTSIKNVLLFNPEILKRFVNFMNNPDEDTAVAQFGKDDKYFGVCTVLATLPGLPMFGHGQIDGYAERYGMEYRRAYWDESPDKELLARHEKEIFPLLKKRYLFAEVSQFLLYDFYSTDGSVNEDVIAYSNRIDNERSLVVYHNKYATVKGWLKTSLPYMVKTGAEESSGQKTLAEGLGLNPGSDYFTIFRDHANGLEYIRSSADLFDKGLYIELEAFKRNVFLDFREVTDDKNRNFSKLTAMLNGAGVNCIDDTLRKHFLNPLIEPFRTLVNPEFYKELEIAIRAATGKEKAATDVFDVFEKRFPVFLQEVGNLSKGSGDSAAVSAGFSRLLRNAGKLTTLKKRSSDNVSPATRQALLHLTAPFESPILFTPILITWALLHRLEEFMKDSESVLELLQDWLLDECISELFRSLNVSEEERNRALAVVTALISFPNLLESLETKTAAETFSALFKNESVRESIGVNEHDGVLWFHKESCEALFHWYYLVSVIEVPVESQSPSPTPGSAKFEDALNKNFLTAQRFQDAVQRSGYRLDKMKLEEKG